MQEWGLLKKIYLYKIFPILYRSISDVKFHCTSNSKRHALQAKPVPGDMAQRIMAEKNEVRGWHFWVWMKEILSINTGTCLLLTVELVSKELNHLAAILHVYAGGLIFMK